MCHPSLTSKTWWLSENIDWLWHFVVYSSSVELSHFVAYGSVERTHLVELWYLGSRIYNYVKLLLELILSHLVFFFSNTIVDCVSCKWERENGRYIWTLKRCELRLVVIAEEEEVKCEHYYCSLSQSAIQPSPCPSEGNNQTLTESYSWRWIHGPSLCSCC